MPSYKPVIYTFSIIGLLMTLGIGGLIAYALQQASSMPYNQGAYGSTFDSNSFTDDDYDQMRMSSSSSDQYLDLDSSMPADNAASGMMRDPNSMGEPGMMLDPNMIGEPGMMLDNGSTQTENQLQGQTDAEIRNMTR